MNINPANLINALSPYDEYCDGYGHTGPSGNSYILGLILGVGVTDISLSHPGSNLLDDIIAFDLAETDGPYIGQLNMSTVSSFCGPQGLIWGYDIVKNDSLYEKLSNPLFSNPIEYKDKSINVYDANKLVDATKCLFGTVDDRRFILRPGAHVPFAGKHKFITDEGKIYSAFAIGISEDREHDACLLMEDIGILKSANYETDETTILTNLAKSIISVGLNQRVHYKECFVAIEVCEVKNNQIGCALVAAPYFTLAKNAVLRDDSGNFDFNSMLSISLSEWEKRVLIINEIKKEV